MIIDRTGTWNQLCLEILTVSSPLFVNSCHHGTPSLLRIIRVHPNSCRKTQTPRTAYGKRPDYTWYCHHTEQAWVSSCAVSQTQENSPATRPSWQLRFLHLHSGGSVELLGPFQQYMHDTMQQRECESLDATPLLHDFGC